MTKSQGQVTIKSDGDPKKAPRKTLLDLKHRRSGVRRQWSTKNEKSRPPERCADGYQSGDRTTRAKLREQRRQFKSWPTIQHRGHYAKEALRTGDHAAPGDPRTTGSGPFGFGFRKSRPASKRK